MAKKILIADDDANVRQSLADILSLKGYKILQAATSKETLKKVHEEKPDLILLDTRMPSHTEGDAVCARIKKVEGLKVKVIVYTGYIDAVDADKARIAGADDYVVKTSDFSCLLKAIKKLI